MRKTFRSLIDSGKKFMGTFVQLPCKQVVELMGYCGFDFIIIDNEHATMSEDQTLELVQICDMVGMAAMIRVPDVNEAAIKKALDMGASGLVVPNINNVEDAKRVIRMAKFAPQGFRGACPFVRANQYSAGPEAEFYLKSNQETVIMLLLESVEALEQMEDIISLDGVDIVGIGLVDISTKMGAYGQLDHPLLKDAVEKSIRLSKKYGKPCYTFAANYEQGKAWLDTDTDYLLYAADAVALKDLFKQMRKDFMRL